MIVPPLLEELRRHQVEVWAEDDQLRCAAPAGVLTPALQDRLREEKGSILEFLRSADALARQERAIVPLQPRGEGIPVFAVPGHNGNVFSLRFLAQHLGDGHPFYGLQPPGAEGEQEPLTDIEELAAYFAERIRSFRPDGPFIIAGHCAGGTTAFELARQLHEQGSPATLIALFGSPYPTSARRFSQFLWRLGVQVEWLKEHARTLAALSNRERRTYVLRKLSDRWRKGVAQWREPREPAPPDPILANRMRMEHATLRALRRYLPRPFPAHVVHFLPNRACLRPGHSMRRWHRLAAVVHEYCGPDGCRNDVMLHEPHVGRIAEQFRGYLRRLKG